MGERAFSKLQYGKETNRGTAVAATKTILGTVPPVKADRKPIYPEVNVGLRARAVNSVIYETLVRDTLKVDYGYFQILPMLLTCGLKGGVVAGEVTPAQGDYLWTCTPSLTSANAPDSITLEMGDDVQAFEAEYIMFERLKFSGAVDQSGGAAPVAIEADYFGRQLSISTFTGSLALTVPEYMNAKLARFYLDTAWAGVGTTEKTNILRAFDFEILTGVHPVMAGSGFKYFNTYQEGIIDVMATFTLEGNAAADAIWDAMNSQALQIVRLAINGAQIGTGTTYNLSLDIGGTWEEVIPLASSDRGDNLHTAILHGKYDATGAKLLQALCTTNAASI